MSVWTKRYSSEVGTESSGVMTDGEFFTNWKTVSFLRRTALHGVSHFSSLMDLLAGTYNLLLVWTNAYKLQEQVPPLNSCLFEVCNIRECIAFITWLLLIFHSTVTETVHGAHKGVSLPVKLTEESQSWKPDWDYTRCIAPLCYRVIIL